MTLQSVPAFCQSGPEQADDDAAVPQVNINAPAQPGLAENNMQLPVRANDLLSAYFKRRQHKPSGADSLTEAETLLQAKADTLLNAYFKRNQFRGTALIAFRGKVLLQKGYGWRNVEKQIPHDGNSIFQAASITKTFTATLVMKLAEMKRLSLQDKLSRYYPGYPKGDSITIAHLLSHTSGIYNYTENGEFMQNRSTKPATEAEMLALFRDMPLDFPPGTGWNYSNSGYMLLGYIIQKVTGLSYEGAIRKYIFDPLDMQRSGFDFARLQDADKANGYREDSTGAYTQPVTVTDSSVSFAAGSIYTTAGDLLKWHQGLMNNAIVSPAGWQELSTAKRNGYGYGWDIDSMQGKYTVGHSGGMRGLRTNFVRIPEDDICIVLLSNTETQALHSITEKLVAVLYGLPYRLPASKPVIKPDTAVLRKYTGTYLLAEKNLKVHIVLENGELVAYPERGPRSTLCAISPLCFFLKDDIDFETCFVTDGTGKGVQMTIDQRGRKGVLKRVEE